ncbi:T9SS type A sorting domain-containing protein [Adhaeribacter soli]|uniref:T9SS type A sorting domain-containing protein n=1 Tax=Adhaeribacter soli TaxID=2607655 RepID=A0A5N1ISZ5_9BACT|nr:T9SS type A sorting domain-containing protein [Adhaeribacter soli]KAA9331230.1 T9SS type A sorting domain-containing protein [Adhaeribacter soli]
MRKLLLFFVFWFYLSPVISQAQGIGPMHLRYHSPGVTNHLELIAQVMIPSQPSYRISHDSYISNDTLYVATCYFAGMQTAPITFTDTISLGSIAAGISTLHFKISDSVSPQCIVVSSVTKIQPFAILGPTGIKSDLEKPVLVIYPNPAKDLLLVENAAINAFAIRDISGRLIRKQNFFPELDRKLDVRFLPKGIYLLELHTLNGSVLTKRLVKE